LTVEEAVGMAVWSLPTVIEGGLLLTGHLLPTATLLEKAATLGVSSFLFMGLGVAAGVACGVFRRGDNFSPNEEFRAREKARQKKQQTAQEGREETPEDTMDGEFREIPIEESTPTERTVN